MVLDDDAAVELYARFRGKAALVEQPSATAAYPDFSGGTFDRSGMAFAKMAREHVTTIANSVNSLLVYLRQLKAWALVLQELDDQTRWHAMIEFVNPLAYFCLDAPYRIRQRICASTAYLSHQANRTKVEGWNNQVKLSDPKFKDARRHAQHWNEWAALESALAGLNSPEFCESVDDFRNEHHHGFARRLELGQTSFVERDVTEKGVSYSFGVKGPLTLLGVVEALDSQYEAALSSYAHYLELVSAQRRALLADG